MVISWLTMAPTMIVNGWLMMVNNAGKSGVDHWLMRGRLANFAGWWWKWWTSNLKHQPSNRDTASHTLNNSKQPVLLHPSCCLLLSLKKWRCKPKSTSRKPWQATNLSEWQTYSFHQRFIQHYSALRTLKHRAFTTCSLQGISPWDEPPWRNPTRPQQLRPAACALGRGDEGEETGTDQNEEEEAHLKRHTLRISELGRVSRC